MLVETISGQKNKSPAKKQSLVLKKVPSYSSAESACSASASSSSPAAETSSDSTSSVPGTMASSGFSDRKSTRLNSSHVSISYAVFCLKKKIHCVLLYNGTTS